MPANEAEDSISSLHKLGISAQGQYPSQLVGNQPTVNYSQWVGKPTRIASSPNFNLRSYILPELDCVARLSGKSSATLCPEGIQSIPQYEYSRTPAISTPLNSNDLLVGRQNFLSKWSQPGIFGDIDCCDQQVLSSRSFSGFKFQQEYECADSPTLTANSERSEITEASSDLHFYRGQQPLLRDQQQAAPVAHPMQQSSYKDMQLLQQHMMFKQLQEFQRQQQLEKLDDVKQHNSLNQVSAVGKQGGGGHFSPLINGTPVTDASQMIQNWMQQGTPPLAPGMPNKITFPQEQFLAHRSMGMASQQLDLYGMPISNTTNMGQHPHLLGMSNNPVTLADGQVPNSIIHSSIFANSFVGDPSSVPLDLVGSLQGSLMTKQGFQEKVNSGQIPIQSLSGGVFPANLGEGNSQQTNASSKEFNASQEQPSWPAVQQTAKQLSPSRGLVPLDPMEAKILYNMDDNIWNAFGSGPDMSVGGCGNVLEHAESLNAFPSVQSGSWSALMQSAVGEASSSDTGIQEEWSGLTFQNTDHSTDNQISSLVDSEKHQTGGVGNNLQSCSFSSKAVPLITDSNMSSGFPGFQHPNIQSSIEKREDMSLGGSHDSVVNYNNQHKPSVEEAQKVQLFMSSENMWGGQIFEHNRNGGQLQRVTSTDFSTDNKGHERLGKGQQQIDSEHSFHRRTNETNTKQLSSFLRENSSEFYTSKRLSSHQQRHLGQFKNFDGSSSSMPVDKGYLPDFQDNSPPEEAPARSNQSSNIFEGSTLHDGSNVTAQTGEHMLELLQKVDQSRDDGSMQPFGSIVPNALPKMPGGDSYDPSITQVYPQSSASQGFGLRLGPPSQRLPNANNFLSPQALLENVRNLNCSPINPESLEKNQRYLGPSSSIQSLSSSHELSQRMLAVNRSTTPLQMGLSSNLNVQGNSLTSITLDSPQTRNQFQTQYISDVPEKSQSWQVKLSSSVGKHSPFTQSSTQYAHDEIPTKPLAEKFPVLETSLVPQPTAMSGSSQQGEILTRPHNVWRNVPSRQQPSGSLTLKFPSPLSSSVDLPNNSLTNSSEAHCLSNDQEYVRSGHEALEFGVSANVQGFGFGTRKEILQQRTTAGIFDNSHSGGLSQDQDHASDATFHTSALLVDHSQLQDLHRAANSVTEVKHATGNQLDNNGSSSRQTLDSGPNAALQPNQPAIVDTRILSFLGEVKDSQIGKASSKSPLLVGPSQDIVTFSLNDSQTQSSSKGLESNHTNYGQVNLRMAPSWFKQNGSLQNGQTVPMFDPGLAKTTPPQFSIGKQSQDLHIQTSVEQLSAADADQGGRVWTNANTSSVANQQFTMPYMLRAEMTNQLAIIRPKKRKTISSQPLPWQKEVTQDSKRVRNMSTSEEDWAQATNRLIEKVEDELIEEVRPVVQLKRRLVLTRQLMQQLFCPAPAMFLSADSASNYDLVSYLVSRLSLGNTCSTTYCKSGDLFEAVDQSSIYAEKLKVSERSDQQFVEVLNNFVGKAKKLEQDFQRLEKTSVVDIRLELKEMEKFSVINRFAKFHVRGYMDASGILRPSPQKYFAALPSPKNLPDEAQCLSL